MWRAGHTSFILAIFLFLLLAPIQARVLEGQGYATLSWIILWIGFVWMGLLLLFVCLGIPLDAYHLSLGSLQQLFNADWTHLMLSRRQNVTLVAALAGGLFIYGAYAAYEVQVRHHILHSAKIPESTGRIRIVQISDLHVGPMTYPGRLNPVLSAIRAAEPDILVSTGDLVDGMHPDLSTIAAEFKNLPAPLGKFAVTGNHEFYRDIQSAAQFTQAAGFTLLRGSAMKIADHIIMAGVDDPAGGPGADAAEARMLENLSEGSIRHPAQTPARGRARRWQAIRSSTFRAHPQRTDFPLPIVGEMGLPAIRGMVSNRAAQPFIRKPRDRHMGPADPDSGTGGDYHYRSGVGQGHYPRTTVNT
jgi:hypothetical protein